MAVSITSNYVGNDLTGYISKALLSGTTLGGDNISVLEDVAYRMAIKKLDLTGIIQDSACDFTDAGTLTIAERYINPAAKMVNLKACIQDFKPSWNSAVAAAGENNYDLKMADVIVEQIIKGIAADVERMIWVGTDGADGVDGLTVKALADATVVDVVGTTVTTANVIAEVTKVYEAIPNTVKNDPEMRIFMAPGVFSSYKLATITQVATNLPGALNELNFAGIKVVLANGLGANEMFAASKSNLFFGTNLLSDHNEVRVIDMREVDGSQNIRFVARFNLDVNYANGAEIVYYT